MTNRKVSPNFSLINFEILIEVLVYIEDLVKDKSPSFELTDEQKKSWLEMKKRPYSEHTEIESFINDFKSEYGI